MSDEFTLESIQADVAVLREAEAAAPVGRWEWKQCYELDEMHWALVSPASEALGSVVDSYMVLWASYPTAMDGKPVSEQPSLKFIAACRPSDDPLHWTRRLEWLVSEVERLRLEAEARDAFQIEFLKRQSDTGRLIDDLGGQATAIAERIVRLEAEVERARLTGDCLVRLEQENERQENLLRRCREFIRGRPEPTDASFVLTLMDDIDRELKGDATDD